MWEGCREDSQGGPYQALGPVPSPTRSMARDNGIMAAVRSLSVCPWPRLAMEPTGRGLLRALDENLLKKGSAVVFCEVVSPARRGLRYRVDQGTKDGF